MKQYHMDLSRGESLRLDRERLGLSQTEAASRKKISLHKYRSHEREVLTGFISVPVYIYEDYRIQRWRIGMTRKKFAKLLKLSEFWISEMEFGRAPIDRLQKFWESYVSRP